jgi:hypothetical protein
MKKGLGGSRSRVRSHLRDSSGDAPAAATGRCERAYTNGFGSPCPCQGLPVCTERYGAFLQASYKIGEPLVPRSGGQSEKSRLTLT